METKYNGWTNYETWCVNLWLSNEEPSYRYWRDEAERCLTAACRPSGNETGERREQAERLLADCLKAELEEGHPLPTASVYSDLLTSALAEVDWHEIARNLLDDIEPDTSGDNSPESDAAGGTLRPVAETSPKFPLGRTVATPAALAALSPEEITVALSRHERGDWGNVCSEDWESNEFALREGLRLFSVYHTAAHVKFWIITEAERSVTTVLLPGDE